MEEEGVDEEGVEEEGVVREVAGGAPGLFCFSLFVEFFFGDKVIPLELASHLPSEFFDSENLYRNLRL